jgi:hypothetical protein
MQLMLWDLEVLEEPLTAHEIQCMLNHCVKRGGWSEPAPIIEYMVSQSGDIVSNPARPHEPLRGLTTAHVKSSVGSSAYPDGGIACSELDDHIPLQGEFVAIVARQSYTLLRADYSFF